MIISPNGPSRLRWRGVVPTVLVISLVMLTHIAGRIGGYCCPEQDDSYIFTSFGYRMAQGDVLYQDMSDIKPPGLFVLYALTYQFAPPARSSVALLESAFLILGYGVIYLFSREQFGKGAAAICVAFAALAVNYFSVMGHAIGGFGLAESFMVLPAASAAYCYHRAPKDGLAWLLGCGVGLGFAAALKQTALPLVLAVFIGWTLSAGTRAGSLRRWAVGVMWLAAGMAWVWTPFLAMLVIQGTGRLAFSLMTASAGAKLSIGQAWPADVADIRPLILPGLWILWGLTSLGEARWRGRRLPALSTISGVEGRTVLFLALWGLLELGLLRHLPLRSAHYYIPICIPWILLSGWPIGRLWRSAVRLPARQRTCTGALVVMVAALFYRSSLDALVPAAIARYRGYDWAEDRRRFDEALRWGNVHFGIGPPRFEPTTSPDKLR